MDRPRLSQPPHRLLWPPRWGSVRPMHLAPELASTLLCPGASVSPAPLHHPLVGGWQRMAPRAPQSAASPAMGTTDNSGRTSRRKSAGQRSNFRAARRPLNNRTPTRRKAPQLSGGLPVEMGYPFVPIHPLEEDPGAPCAAQRMRAAISSSFLDTSAGVRSSSSAMDFWAAAGRLLYVER